MKTEKKGQKKASKSGSKKEASRNSPKLVRLPEKVSILDLKPTQFAVGMLEVDEKIAMVSEYSKKQLKAY
ncbi:MAG: hypothetical protein EOP06_21655, partial [Proteobacteria bacterium]